jgi:AcrR family transcriptional regulator
MNDVQNRSDKPVKPEQRRLEVRQKLLEAAARKVALEGLHALKARELATEVGCSVGQIYNLYPDMDALILAVNAQTLQELGEKVGAARKSPTPATPEEAFADLVAQAQAYLRFAFDNRNRWQAVFQHRLEGSPQPDWYLELKENLFAHITVPLERLLPSMNPQERTLLGRTIFSAVHGIVSLGVEELLAPQTRDQLSQQLDIVVNALVRGLQRREDERR